MCPLNIWLYWSNDIVRYRAKMAMDRLSRVPYTLSLYFMLSSFLFNTDASVLILFNQILKIKKKGGCGKKRWSNGNVCRKGIIRRGHEKSFNEDQNQNHDCQDYDDLNQVGLWMHAAVGPPPLLGLPTSKQVITIINIISNIIISSEISKIPWTASKSLHNPTRFEKTKNCDDLDKGNKWWNG